ncbi:MAG: S1C family serine protease [Minwuia sp.]|nr:S1C family serine protease [Minwuia sp.]
MRTLLRRLFLLALCPIILVSTAQASETPFQRALDSLVRVDAEIAPDGRTAQALGVARHGTGVVIDDSGLVLTIGYLILEAMTATVTDIDGNAVPAEVVAYDHATGLGLLRAQGPLNRPAARLGDSSELDTDMPVLIAGFKGKQGAWPAAVADVRDFSGYWEYLLEDAVFTTPAVPEWQGAALFGPDWRLIGVGSLYVRDARRRPTRGSGNMFVPVNALKRALGDMLAIGKGRASERPWLGVFSNDQRGYVVVTYVAADGPAALAGLRPGDIILEVDGEPVRSMSDLYRKIWKLGDPGVSVPLTLGRDGGISGISVTSGDRYRYLKWGTTY